MTANKLQNRSLQEMHNVSTDPELGNWTESQRMIIGAWHKHFKEGELPVAKKDPLWAKWFGVLFYGVLFALAVQFLYQGGENYREERAARKVDKVTMHITKDSTCYKSKAGLSCLPNWLIDYDKEGQE